MNGGVRSSCSPSWQALVLYYLKDGRVRGVLLWSVWGQVDAARQLIAEPLH